MMSLMLRGRSRIFNTDGAEVELRRRVLNSTKYIIPNYIMRVVVSDPGTLMSAREDTFETRGMERIAELRDFVRLPFPSIFLENSTTGVLLEQVSERIFDMTYCFLGMDGYSEAITTRIDTSILDSSGETLAGVTKVYFDFNEHECLDFVDGEMRLSEGFLKREYNSYVVGDKNGGRPYQFHTIMDDPEEVEKHIRLQYLDHADEFIYPSIELLLMLNVTNSEQQRYRVSRKEAALYNVTPGFLSKYEYRILDLDRRQPVIRCMNDVMDFMDSGRGSRERRAHLVAGHFKNRRGKLYWWRFHERCSRNKDTLGFVEKDYRVTV